MALVGGVPILQEYYAVYQRHGLSSRITASAGWDCGMTMLARGMVNNAPTPVTAEARLSFWKAFGVTPTTQKSIEEQLRKLSLSMETVGWVPSLRRVPTTRRKAPVISNYGQHPEWALW
jgi:hypothetical protein